MFIMPFKPTVFKIRDRGFISSQLVQESSHSSSTTLIKGFDFMLASFLYFSGFAIKGSFE